MFDVPLKPGLKLLVNWRGPSLGFVALHQLQETSFDKGISLLCEVTQYLRALLVEFIVQHGRPRTKNDTAIG